MNKAGTGAATTADAPDVAEYPAVPAWEPDPAQREHLRRSLTLLSTVRTKADRQTVRILFYGQSITEQAWSNEVAQYLRATYTNVNLIIENRAIGGHSAQLLVKTAEADLYPFQPDLLIFHVYGSHIEYENIIRRVRERTCADILLQTDHITKDDALAEPTDPAQLTPIKGSVPRSVPGLTPIWAAPCTGRSAGKPLIPRPVYHADAARANFGQNSIMADKSRGHARSLPHRLAWLKDRCNPCGGISYQIHFRPPQLVAAG